MAIIKKAKNITIKVNKDYTLVAGAITEIADKITITATKGNLTLSSNKKIIMQGLNGGVKYGTYEPPKITEKAITEVIWMNSPMEKQISEARNNELLSLKVKTKNYNEGEMISLVIKDEENQEKNIQLIGYVNEKGFAVLQEIMYADSENLNKNTNLA